MSITTTEIDTRPDLDSLADDVRCAPTANQRRFAVSQR